MKKMLFAVALLVAAVCALTVINAAYDVNPTVTLKGETANAIATSSADEYTYDRQDYPVGLNAENQYDILADNDLYGHVDYGDYVPAKTRYVDGFPTVDGEKTYDKYYGTDGYIYPGEEEKLREDWNLHDFHKHGELFESVGNGEMHFYNEEDREAYLQGMKDEFGAENVKITTDTNATYSGSSSTADAASGNTASDASSSDSEGSGNSIIDQAKDAVDSVNERQDATSDAVNSMN